jgi:hypothetical protein
MLSISEKVADVFKQIYSSLVETKSQSDAGSQTHAHSVFLSPSRIRVSRMPSCPACGKPVYFGKSPPVQVSRRRV